MNYNDIGERLAISLRQANYAGIGTCPHGWKECSLQWQTRFRKMAVDASDEVGFPALYNLVIDMLTFPTYDAEDLSSELRQAIVDMSGDDYKDFPYHVSGMSKYLQGMGIFPTGDEDEEC